MKPLTVQALLLANVFTRITITAAQNVTPEAFCKAVGPTYTPKYEPDGSFNGECEIASGQICLGNEYTTPKGAYLCCNGGSVMAIDTTNNNAACCQPGKVYKGGACVNLPPQISCPGSNGQRIRQNNINFDVWCHRNIIEYVNPFDFGAKMSAVMNMNKRGSATFQDCLDICAADSKCQGANWWYGKGLCGINNMPQGGGWFKKGGDYKNPPDIAYLDNRVISMVAVPQR